VDFLVKATPVAQRDSLLDWETRSLMRWQGAIGHDQEVLD
jgi:hypothetical protein